MIKLLGKVRSPFSTVKKKNAYKYANTASKFENVEFQGLIRKERKLCF